MSSSHISRALPSSLLLAAALLAGTASANERHFGYTYESGVLAPGAKELEVYNTLRAGREDYYSALDHRLSFEVGVANNLMTAFYFNMNNTTEGDPAGNLSTAFEWQGFSNEWKLKLQDPVADPVGLALYTELTFNTSGMELEPKLILDKRMGPWLLAANLIGEFEYEAKADEMELEEIAPDVTFGVSRELAKGFHAGLEIRNHNAIVRNPDSEDLEHAFSAVYFGPVVSYATESWWMTFTVLPQLPALSKESGGSILVLDDGEKINARLLFSFHI
ncbi:MAG: conserved hypothetical secreted protein [Fibrobacteres bacterium]|nr:conserved hypothetical secreted protein [Fibrobacterota bacterium]